MNQQSSSPEMTGGPEQNQGPSPKTDKTTEALKAIVAQQQAEAAQSDAITQQTGAPEQAETQSPENSAEQITIPNQLVQTDLPQVDKTELSTSPEQVSAEAREALLDAFQENTAFNLEMGNIYKDLTEEGIEPVIENQKQTGDMRHQKVIDAYFASTKARTQQSPGLDAKTDAEARTTALEFKQQTENIRQALRNMRSALSEDLGQPIDPGDQSRPAFETALTKIDKLINVGPSAQVAEGKSPVRSESAMSPNVEAKTRNEGLTGGAPQSR